jgi:O-antigen/teichoic acid export membrane protein
VSEVGVAAAEPSAAAADASASSGSEEGTQDLRTKVAGGLRWKLLSQVVGLVSQTIVAIVLAHLLTPKEFGLAAMALVFTALTTIFTDLSLGAALVQRPQITEHDRSTVFWTSVGASLVVAAIWVAVSPLVGDFFSNSAVVPLFAATGASALLWGIAGTQIALLTRSLDFRSLELREIGGTLTGGIAAIALAATGAGAWAIVGQNLITAGVSALLVWRLSTWRPRFVYSRDSLRTLGSFGIKTLFSRLMSYANSYADNLLVGRFLGTVSLGVYSIAYSVMYLPTTRVAAPIQQVLFPAFSRLQHDSAALGRSWVRGMQLIAVVNASACLGMAVVAPDFVPVVFGHKWLAAVPVIQLLSLAGAAESLKTLNWSVLQAVGASGLLARLMMFATIVTVGAFAVGLRWGVVGVAGLFAVARAIVAVSFGLATCRKIGLPFATLGRGVARVGALVLPMAVVVYLLRLALVAARVAPVPRLVLVTVIGAVLYVSLIRWRAPDLLEEITRMLLPRIRSARRRRRRDRKKDLNDDLLSPAVRTLARRCPLAVELDVKPARNLPDECQVLAYYIVSETLANAAKHARASVVQVGVEQRDALLTLVIRDDGVGGADLSRGFRLRQLRERVESVGGTFELTSPKERGSVVTVSLPVVAAEPARVESDEVPALAAG